MWKWFSKELKAGPDEGSFILLSFKNIEYLCADI